MRVLFFMEVTENVVGQRPQDLTLNIGDMVGITQFNKTEPHMFGVLLEEKYRDKWWEFNDVPYEEAILRPHGRFPSDAVRLP